MKCATIRKISSQERKKDPRKMTWEISNRVREPRFQIRSSASAPWTSRLRPRRGVITPRSSTLMNGQATVCYTRRYLANHSPFAAAAGSVPSVVPWFLAFASTIRRGSSESHVKQRVRTLQLRDIRGGTHPLSPPRSFQRDRGRLWFSLSSFIINYQVATMLLAH